MSTSDLSDSYIWVFNGDGKSLSFPGGVFSSQGLAEGWIALNRLTGILTGYPVDVGVYDWAKERGLLSDWVDDEGKELPRVTNPSPHLVGRFSTAHLPHFHYADGARQP